MLFSPNESDWRGNLRTVVERWTSVGDDYLADNPFDHFVFKETADTWLDFVQWHEPLIGRWIFRGQRSAEWNLHSSLDRAVRMAGATETCSFVTHADRRSTEDRLLFRFKQQAHRYVRHLPEEADLVSWLALMQHHGVPSRLLDFTLSPYVAAYFGCENASDPGKFAVWALNLDWLNERANTLLQIAGQRPLPHDPQLRSKRANEVLTLLDPDDSAIINALLLQVEPSRTDAWMAGQQGVFLCKTYSQATFNQCLMRMMLKPELVGSAVVRKLEIDTSMRMIFLKRLRAMNIHRGSLFPDLDGFSQSLSLDWEIEKDEIRAEMVREPSAPRDEDGSPET